MQTNRVVPSNGSVVYYRTDGTGRDSYIKNINGGLLSHDRLHQLKQVKPLKQKSFTFAKTIYGRHPFTYQRKNQNKFVHYVSDGTGRDHYITSNEGGSSNVFRWRDQTEFKFRNSLRAGSKLLERNPQDSDIFTASQMKFTQTQSKFHRTMSMLQTTRNSELSEPKKCPKPPAMAKYFDKDFDASKQFRKLKYGKNH